MAVQESTPGSTERFRIRGGSYTLLVVRFAELRDPDFFGWLERKIAQAPYFFQQAPLVLDLQDTAEATRVEFQDITARLREHGLVLVGVQGGSEVHNEAAAAAGLSVFPVWRSAAPAAEVGSEDQGGEAAAQKAAPAPARIVDHPVRAGQQVYARGGDLVVRAMVSSGGEVLADGHVHIYGPLRGRAFAGVGGDRSARIFCRSFEAELVAVAGRWRVRDEMDEALIGRPAEVRLDGEKLVIAPDE